MQLLQPARTPAASSRLRQTDATVPGDPAPSFLGYNRHMDLVPACIVNNEFTAQSLIDLLDQSGIPAMLRRNVIPGYEMTLPSAITHGWGEILVRPEDLEQARELIAGFQGSLGELAETEPQDFEA